MRKNRGSFQSTEIHPLIIGTFIYCRRGRREFYLNSSKQVLLLSCGGCGELETEMPSVLAGTIYRELIDLSFRDFTLRFLFLKNENGILYYYVISQYAFP